MSKSHLCLVFAILPLVAPSGADPAERLLDAPIVWYEDDQRDISQPKERKINLLKDQFHTTFVRPVRRTTSPSNLIQRIGGDPYGPAENVNALDARSQMLVQSET